VYLVYSYLCLLGEVDFYFKWKNINIQYKLVTIKAHSCPTFQLCTIYRESSILVLLTSGRKGITGLANIKVKRRVNLLKRGDSKLR
jgi:hypothetical protein